MQTSKEIVVVGAGIIGVSIAYHLAQSGERVTLLEKGEPGRGTTADSFAWINASRGKKPYHYYQLNLLGIAAWRQLDQALDGQLQIRWGGSVEWTHSPEDAAEIEAGTGQHQAWGYPLQKLTEKRLHALEPNVTFDEPDLAIYSTIEGHVDPVHATQTLLTAAKKAGVRVMTGCAVIGLAERDGRLTHVETEQGAIPCDLLVIACGNGTPTVAAMAGIDVPLQPSPGLLAHSAPQPALINRIVLSPHGHMKQKPDGRIVVGASFEGAGEIDASMEAGQQLFDTAAHSLPHLSDIAVDKVTLGWRVLPQDKLPIIGFAPGRSDIYLAAMHSGMTLGPLVGQLATLEIGAEAEVEPLKPFRLDRFLP